MEPPALEPRRSVAERARRLGPLPYSELGLGVPIELPPAPILGLWTADLLDRLWHQAGEPDPLVYIEVGAGDGSRARELLSLGPECLLALRMVLVEEDPALRSRHLEQVAVESPSFVLGPSAPSEDPEEGPAAVSGVGPLVTSLAELPVVAESGAAVLIAFGWLSRQPSDRFERAGGTWSEIRLAAASEEGKDSLSEVAVPLDETRSAELDRFVGAFPGSIPDRNALYPRFTGASQWLANALRTSGSGWLVVVDRWSETTMPVEENQPIPIALEQLSPVRRPLGLPEVVAGRLSAVCWRLG